MKNRIIKFRRRARESFGGEWEYAVMDELGYIIWRFASDSIEKGTLTEYIGREDKNGKEIYEGDILRAFRYELPKNDDWSKNGEKHYHQGDVYYEDGMFLFHSKTKNGEKITPRVGLYYKGEEKPSNDLEVIGNKFDNSELLKK
ncbi:MAG TPA: hypothetical protein ENI23_14125 [bacterium]|nr:hypothetical protein [bacterium]